MGQVAVAQFEVWDINLGDWSLHPTFGTQQVIDQRAGRLVDEFILVDENELTEYGTWIPPKDE